MPAVVTPDTEDLMGDAEDPDEAVLALALLGKVPRDAVKNFPHSKRVGSYLVGKMINKGSFAKVMEGLHLSSGEKVAVKVIDKKKARQDSYVLKNMKREPRIHQMVRHPNVVQLYETLETENSYYMAMELCVGGDLMDRICERKRLDEREARRYTRQILSAVEHLHRHGIVHRDLKIENFLLDESNNIKIVDFGLSNTLKAEALSPELLHTQCGSPAYAAPELLAHRKYGPKVDVWSVGISTFAMLTGTLPFTVEPFNIKQLHQKMVNSDIGAIPCDISKASVQFVLSLLEPDPDKRPSITEAMEHKWLMEAHIRQPLSSVLHKNRLQPDDLNPTVLRYMTESLGYRLSDIIHTLINNRPSAIMATYCLLVKKLTRQQKGARASKKEISAERSGRHSGKPPKNPNHNTVSQNRRKRTNESPKENQQNAEDDPPSPRRASLTTDIITDDEIAITLENKESFFPEVSTFAERELVRQLSPKDSNRDASGSKLQEVSPCEGPRSDSGGIKPQKSHQLKVTWSEGSPLDPVNLHVDETLEKQLPFNPDKSISPRTHMKNLGHSRSPVFQDTRFRDVLRAMEEKTSSAPWRNTTATESLQTAPLPKLRHPALRDSITRKLTWVGMTQHGPGRSPFLVNGSHPPGFPASRQQALIIKSLRQPRERGHDMTGPEPVTGGNLKTKRNTVQLRNSHKGTDLSLPALAPPFQAKADKNSDILRMDF